MKNRSVVGAHCGTWSWLLQRVSAVLVVLYVFTFFFFFRHFSSIDFDSWRALFAPFWFRALTFWVFASLCLHTWVGMRDIFMDYIKPLMLRLILQVVVAFILLSYLFRAFKILQGVA